VRYLAGYIEGQRFVLDPRNTAETVKLIADHLNTSEDVALGSYEAPANSSRDNFLCAHSPEQGTRLRDQFFEARFGELGVFPEEVDIPIGIIARLWAGCAKPETGRLDLDATDDLLSDLLACPCCKISI
jgi:hypothetical protein